MATTGPATTVTAHPYLSRWVHDLVVAPPGTAMELRGAVRADLSGVGGPVLNLFGHCVFDDAHGTAAQSETSARPSPIRIDTPAVGLVVEPVLHR
ncbi:hypothetical protein [Williamsia deligens]|uniref:Uncharacterized protein n=1 Tax=Williamsia deligens TaxID=321325 RepID=A0ABW3G274_9NOCA|nr:hypothetical protein [Williamsia deligens]MCP2195008.1 hypothetical protein [Williamsia deligens]